MHFFIIIAAFALGGLSAVIMMSLLFLAKESDKSMEKFYDGENCEENKVYNLNIFDLDSRDTEMQPDKFMVSPMQE
ncbi:MAG: hypothetical protein M0P73_12770 [Syntrophobacterales bacterium]|nr:hypothetical protein [Syntrophobacterales bacterium]